MSPHPPTKSALRQSFLERRLQMLPNDRIKAAETIAQSFFKSVPVAAGVIVAGYWPIKGEVDTLPILRALLQKGQVCALPHVTGEGAPLIFRQWDETVAVVPGKFGISEPANGTALIPDIILVPALAFDEKGYRLGYGAGFYDRTIARLKKQKPVKTVGLAYEMQRYEALPVDGHDVKIDLIITEERTYP